MLCGASLLLKHYYFPNGSNNSEKYNDPYDKSFIIGSEADCEKKKPLLSYSTVTTDRKNVLRPLSVEKL